MHEAVKTWNKVAQGILDLKDAWEDHLIAMGGRPNIELLPPEAQRFLRLTFNRSKFEVAIPRIIDYMRGIGGAEELLVSITKEEKKEKKETK